MATVAMLLVQPWLENSEWRLLAVVALPFAAIRLDMYIWRVEQSKRAEATGIRERRAAGRQRG